METNNKDKMIEEFDKRWPLIETELGDDHPYLSLREIRTFFIESLTKHEEAVVERILKSETIEAFTQATPIWIEELLETDKPCVMCGIIPKNIEKVAKALTPDTPTSDNK